MKGRNRKRNSAKTRLSAVKAAVCKAVEAFLPHTGGLNGFLSSRNTGSLAVYMSSALRIQGAPPLSARIPGAGLPRSIPARQKNIPLPAAQAKHLCTIRTYTVQRDIFS